MSRPQLKLPRSEGVNAIRDRRFLLASRIATAVLCLVIALGVAAPSPADVAVQVVGLALFGVGCAAFLRAYGVAVRRSRSEQISAMVAFLHLPGAPPAVRIELWLAAGVQFAAGLTGAALRPFGPVSFGVLAGVYGLGVIALWGAVRGGFPRRSQAVGERRHG